MKDHRWFYEFARRPAALFIYLVANLEVRGLDRIPERGPVILVANHLSMMDILAVAVPTRRHLHFMAKIELFNVPIVGGIFRLLGAFPVRRGEGDRESLRIAQEVLDARQVLVMFPEGHRSDDHALIRGHTGVALIALRSGATIVPIGITGTERVLKPFFRIGPFAPRVSVTVGEPFKLETSGPKRSREDLERGIDTIMRRIASLLPPRYRGVYAEPSPLPVAALAGSETSRDRIDPLGPGHEHLEPERDDGD